MVTRRKLGWGIAIAASLMANVAFASHYTGQAEEFFLNWCSRERLDGLRAFVCDLRERLDTIQLTPGPQGPEGPQGPQGPQGPVGEASTLTIFDENGSELGPLVDRYTFFYAPLEKLIEVDHEGSPLEQGRLGIPIDAFFTTTDCTGTAYRRFTSDYNRSTNVLFAVGPGKYYILAHDTPEQTITHNSVLFYTDNTASFTCQTSISTAGFREIIPVNLPFADPVVMPLRYGVN